MKINENLSKLGKNFKRLKKSRIKTLAKYKIL